MTASKRFLSGTIRILTAHGSQISY